jgi:hypothetical protein
VSRAPEAVLDVVDHFGAASYETQKVEGSWRPGGVMYRDDLVKIVVDVVIRQPTRRVAAQTIKAARETKKFAKGA